MIRIYFIQFFLFGVWNWKLVLGRAQFLLTTICSPSPDRNRKKELKSRRNPSFFCRPDIRKSFLNNFNHHLRCVHAVVNITINCFRIYYFLESHEFWKCSYFWDFRSVEASAQLAISEWDSIDSYRLIRTALGYFTHILAPTQKPTYTYTHAASTLIDRAPTIYW